jgi:hypothetical protein
LEACKTKYNHTSHGHSGIDQSTNHKTTLLEHSTLGKGNY